jgi:hypothetical protein
MPTHCDEDDAQDNRRAREREGEREREREGEEDEGALLEVRYSQILEGGIFKQTPKPTNHRIVQIGSREES